MNLRTPWQLLAVVFVGLLGFAYAGDPRLVPEHRVLYRYRTTLQDSAMLGYWVRVERYLTERELKSLVCAVIREESPTDYSRLAITFNYRLDSYNLVTTEKYTNSRLANYTWTKKLGGSPYSLFRGRDEHGEPLPRSAQFSSFDHTKECPVEEDSTSEGNPKRPP